MGCHSLYQPPSLPASLLPSLPPQPPSCLPIRGLQPGQGCHLFRLAIHLLLRFFPSKIIKAVLAHLHGLGNGSSLLPLEKATPQALPCLPRPRHSRFFPPAHVAELPPLPIHVAAGGAVPIRGLEKTR